MRGRKAQWPPPVISRRGKDFLVVRSAGSVREFSLGPTGSEAAAREYRRLVAEMESAGRRPPGRPGQEVTVAEVCERFLSYKKPLHHRSHFSRLAAAAGPLVRLYGRTAADDLSPVRLKAVRQEYIQGGYSRDLCNAMTGVVRMAWRWAAGEGLVDPEVPLRLAVLLPLRGRHAGGVVHPPVRPAPIADVEATLPYLWPTVADMVRLQLLTGMRPGEVCALRPGDIDRDFFVAEGGVRVWLYVLEEHKTLEAAGRDRRIPIGPQAQAVLAPYLARSSGEYCFSPLEVKTAQALARGRRPIFGRTRYPGRHYTTQSYGRAVRVGCLKAGVTPWAPNRLRHSAATRVETEFSREDARCFLGHDHPTTTAIYAESVERAARVAARLG